MTNSLSVEPVFESLIIFYHLFCFKDDLVDRCILVIGHVGLQVLQNQLDELVKGNRLVLVCVYLREHLLHKLLLHILHANLFNELLLVNLLDVIVEKYLESLFAILVELVLCQIDCSHGEVSIIHLTITVQVSVFTNAFDVSF